MLCNMKVNNLNLVNMLGSICIFNLLLKLGLGFHNTLAKGDTPVCSWPTVLTPHPGTTAILAYLDSLCSFYP